MSNKKVLFLICTITNTEHQKVNKVTMVSEIDMFSKLPTKNLIDPNGFDLTISALLIGLGAEKYTDIFRKYNIGQCTLTELTDEDLVKLGVDDPEIRVKLINEVKNLPIYEETNNIPINPNLNVLEIIDVLEDSAQHIYRIYLSMMANTLTLKKSKTPDCLIYKDKYSSHIAINTLSNMSNLLNSMEIALNSKIKVSNDSRNKQTKKLLVGTLGSAVIAVLAIYFVRSLKHL